MRVVNSEECSKSELDLFSIPPTQTAIEEGAWDTISPHPNFREGQTIRFDISGTNSHYIDLSQTELHLKVSILNKSATSDADKFLVDADQVGVVNNLLHSLFEQVQVNLNNQPVENTNKTYHFRSYLENLLCYSKEAKQTVLTGDLWVKDEENFRSSFNHIDINAADAVGNTPAVRAVKANKGFVSRRKLFLNGKHVPLCGRIHCDIFNINRYMLSNVDINLILQRAPIDFYLKGKDAGKYKLYVEEAYLKVRRVIVSPSVMLAHATALEKTTA